MSLRDADEGVAGILRKRRSRYGAALFAAASIATGWQAACRSVCAELADPGAGGHRAPWYVPRLGAGQDYAHGLLSALRRATQGVRDPYGRDQSEVGQTDAGVPLHQTCVRGGHGSSRNPNADKGWEKGRAPGTDGQKGTAAIEGDD